jgi:hypothetical protein
LEERTRPRLRRIIPLLLRALGLNIRLFFVNREKKTPEGPENPEVKEEKGIRINTSSSSLWASGVEFFFPFLCQSK